jgi:hypothetical protein
MIFGSKPTGCPVLESHEDFTALEIIGAPFFIWWQSQLARQAASTLSGDIGASLNVFPKLTLMPDKGWHRAFDDPIPVHDGRVGSARRDRLEEVFKTAPPAAQKHSRCRARSGSCVVRLDQSPTCAVAARPEHRCSDRRYLHELASHSADARV